MAELLNRASLAERVSALLRDYIDSSDLQIGDRLESENLLCNRFQSRHHYLIIFACRIYGIYRTYLVYFEYTVVA